MSYIIHQKINSKVYAYEVTGVWDPKIKNSRQKRKYLGRVDPATGKIIRKRELPRPMFAYDYGEIKLGEVFYQRSGLEKAIENIFGEEAGKVKILILSRFLYQLPLKRIGSWYERTYLSKMGLNMSSQRISELLRIMDMKRGEFFRSWISGNEESVYLDITSLPGNSVESMYEYGYSRV